MADQGLLSKEKNWFVPAAHDGIRLDAFVRQILPHLSHREAQRAIDERLFLVNGRPGRKGARLAASNVVSFVGPDLWLAEGPTPNPQLRVPIVYEDAQLLVVDKPAGMDTHGFSGRDCETLANFLAAAHPEVLGIGKSRWEPGLVHRLDRETSGLVLVAKRQAAFEHLRSQFRRREIRKTYWALVWGASPADGSVDYPLEHDAREKSRMRAVSAAPMQAKGQRIWQALTRFRTLGAARGLSLLEIEMVTGVTHQIRVHLAAIGHPIVGDALYRAQHTESFGLQRHFLHAGGLEFNHPEDGRRMKVEAGLPEGLQEVLERLAVKL